ncbi:hypothetical protein BAUCODRAFT_26296 [Baudoinia panamericana UAMH 10762]|uniref:REJ domain-containing protein n=1 Tax=Baudoinia panamericana (strain UAMH 10762) TaxID=717646 RepID=M2MC64_BAUPA|nr:uncharacterized protein BAUCODRAFT_26296 [Baudoinia panamericana UAMH 10762]EMC94091.1 hypothetical protein BAUCODRAFT_26296 [Baudoinia panamericana UAMH 10762]
MHSFILAAPAMLYLASIAAAFPGGSWSSSSTTGDSWGGSSSINSRWGISSTTVATWSTSSSASSEITSVTSSTQASPTSSSSQHTKPVRVRELYELALSQQCRTDHAVLLRLQRANIPLLGLDPTLRYARATVKSEVTTTVTSPYSYETTTCDSITLASVSQETSVSYTESVHTWTKKLPVTLTSQTTV